MGVDLQSRRKSRWAWIYNSHDVGVLLFVLSSPSKGCRHVQQVTTAQQHNVLLHQNILRITTTGNVIIVLMMKLDVTWSTGDGKGAIASIRAAGRDTHTLVSMNSYDSQKAKG